MPMIPTGRTYVMVGRPLPHDTVVAVFMPTPGLGHRLHSVQPVAHFNEAVRFALSMVEYMIGPIEVLPYESAEALDYAMFASNLHELAYAAKDEAVRAEATSMMARLLRWSDVRGHLQ